MMVSAGFTETNCLFLCQSLVVDDTQTHFTLNTWRLDLFAIVISSNSETNWKSINFIQPIIFFILHSIQLDFEFICLFAMIFVGYRYIYSYLIVL